MTPHTSGLGSCKNKSTSRARATETSLQVSSAGLRSSGRQQLHLDAQPTIPPRAGPRHPLLPAHPAPSAAPTGAKRGAAPSAEPGGTPGGRDRGGSGRAGQPHPGARSRAGPPRRQSRGAEDAGGAARPAPPTLPPRSPPRAAAPWPRRVSPASRPPLRRARRLPASPRSVLPGAAGSSHRRLPRAAPPAPERLRPPRTRQWPGGSQLAAGPPPPLPRRQRVAAAGSRARPLAVEDRAARRPRGGRGLRWVRCPRPRGSLGGARGPAPQQRGGGGKVGEGAGCVQFPGPRKS